MKLGAACLTLKAVKALLSECVCYLSRPVRTIVEENDAVTGAYNALLVADDRLNKFVGNAFVIAAFNRRHGVCGMDAFTHCHSVKRFFHSVPALVSIHGVKAPLNRGDLANAKLLHLALKLGKKARSAGGGNVASIQKGMDVDLFNALTLRHLQKRVKMGIVAVNTAVGQKPHKVKRSILPSAAIHCGGKRLVFKKRAVTYCVGDKRQHLIYNASGADVRVTDLAVADLPLRQTNVNAGSHQRRVWAFVKQLVEYRCVGSAYGVIITCGSKPEAVQNKEDRRDFTHLLSSPVTAATAAMILEKSSGLREAPPIRPPSISGILSSSSAFLAFIEPP